MNERNCACFNINIEHLRNHTDEVAQAFADLKIVPIKVEVGDALGDYTYVALSPYFDEVSVPCLKLPWYCVLVDVVDGKRSYRLKRITDAEAMPNGLR